MNHLRIALAVSVGLHVIVFCDMKLPFSRMLPSQPESRVSDYHIPMAVELAGPSAPESPLKPVESAEDSSKPEFAEKKTLTRFPTERIRIKTSPKKQLLNRDREKENAAAMGAEAPSSSPATWNLPPVYPEESRRLKQEGRVLLEARLDDSGSVISVRIVRSSGFSALDEAAVQAVKGWRMDVPRSSNHRIFIPITFTLQRGSSSNKG